MAQPWWSNGSHEVIGIARVTGVGGVFLRARDPKALAEWYAKHLGITLSEYGGATFAWTDEVPAGTGMTSWNTFPQETDYFGERAQQAIVIPWALLSTEWVLSGEL